MNVMWLCCCEQEEGGNASVRHESSNRHHSTGSFVARFRALGRRALLLSRKNGKRQNDSKYSNGHELMP
jgi:hypothetical protein